MGYHIILNYSSNEIKHHYIENINELANFPLREDSIVYQGEKDWKPMLAKHSEEYINFTFDWHRAGIKAQNIFKEQAIKNEYILEELNQDAESFKCYTQIKDEYLKIKRGDFLIRNAQNIEVDVKCRTFYTPKGKDYNCFDFNVEHLERHLNMKSFTKTPIVIAVYKRVCNTDEVEKNSLRMIEIDHMKQKIDELKLKPIKKSNDKKEEYFVYQIPIKNTMPEFTLINYILSE